MLEKWVPRFMSFNEKAFKIIDFMIILNLVLAIGGIFVRLLEFTFKSQPIMQVSLSVVAMCLLISIYLWTHTFNKHNITKRLIGRKV